MKKKHIFGVNNYNGVHVEGLKDSLYDIKEYIPEMEIIEEILEDEDDYIAKNFNTVVTTSNNVFEFSDKKIKEGYIPLLFGGDHSVAIGSISATANNYKNLGLLWIDAHTDINTEASSISKNIHGMPVSYLLGNNNEKLSKIGGFKPKLLPDNIVYFGLRDVEPQEKEIINKLNIKSYYYNEIQERGIEICFKEALEYLNKCNSLHIQFDFDSMDPTIFPAVSVPVQSGFNQKEVIYMFDNILSNDKVIAIDLVEYNKSFDKNEESLNFAKKLIDKILNEELNNL